MWSKAKIMRMAERTLKRTEAYRENSKYNTFKDNYKLLYVLVKGSKSALDEAVAYAHWLENVVVFDPRKADGHTKQIWDFSFMFDTDLFVHLEQGYELAGMSLEAHRAAWMEISTCHREGVNSYPRGFQRYLQYCRQNGVTAELLHQRFQYSGMDVMTLYDKSESKSRSLEAVTKPDSWDITDLF